MGVGVHEPLDEDLIEVAAKQLRDEALAVDLGLGELAEGGDVATVDVLHRQNVFGRIAGDRSRDHDALELRERVAQPAKVIGLEPIVELGSDRGAELIDHRRESVPAARGRVLIDELRELLDDVDVVLDLGPDPRSLHLHRDSTTVAQDGAVHLPE